jgi:hypothetical protein
MRQKAERTNLASEFYVLSTLYRLKLKYGIEPFLTLGNKKSVDILVITNDKKIFTIDVKGLASKTSWLLGSNKPEVIQNHYYILLTYLNNIEDIDTKPESYIISSNDLQELKLIKSTKKGYIIDYKQLRDNLNFKENWSVFK